MKNIKFRIYAKAVGLQIALIVAMRFLMPLLANYPPFSETTAFQNEVEAMTHPLEYEDVVLREDTISDELLVDEVLSNAKEKTLEEVIVPKVVE